MAAPTPIHRDPDADGDDYGCVGPNAEDGNSAVAELVADVRHLLNAGTLGDAEEILSVVRTRLEEIDEECDCGSCDTIVKENVFAALHDAVESAGLEPIDQILIYGW